MLSLLRQLNNSLCYCAPTVVDRHVDCHGADQEGRCLLSDTIPKTPLADSYPRVVICTFVLGAYCSRAALQNSVRVAAATDKVVGVSRLYFRCSSTFVHCPLLVRTTLKGRKKLSHIEGKAPGKNDPQFEAWGDEDSLIMTWLWHSMTPEISRNCMFFANAREIWDNLSQTYSMKKDIVACYELENKIFSTKQGVLSVTDYYSVLNGLWIELDQYQNLKMKCTADSATLTEFIDRARIFKFLSGLNSEFDPIRIQILGKEKLPSLSEVFYTVRGEENRRTVMFDDPPIDCSALVSGKGPTKGSSAGKFSLKPARDDRWCTYCKSGHTKETCFRLHGKEKVLARKGTTQKRANHVAFDSEIVSEDLPTLQTEEEVPTLSKAELEHLRALIDFVKSLEEAESLELSSSPSLQDLMPNTILDNNPESTENDEKNWFCGQQYQRKRKNPILVQQQLQSPEPEIP
ncbi:hypothetical protein SESBI_32748 [Sesbania bispinosa]|nr:hypothetical protein SESBI_32748 [Sesbania bispinosa]